MAAGQGLAEGEEGQPFVRRETLVEAVALLDGAAAPAVVVADGSEALDHAAAHGAYALTLPGGAAILAMRMQDLFAAASRLLNLRAAVSRPKVARFDRRCETLDSDRYAALGLAGDLAAGLGFEVQCYAAPELADAAGAPVLARERLASVLTDAEVALVGHGATAKAAAASFATLALPGGWRQGAPFDIFLVTARGREPMLLDFAQRLDASLGNSASPDT